MGRGCIGTFQPKPLAAALKEYALIAALEDSRFTKITKEELPSLQCCVSLLVDFEKADDWQDWEIGVHGIRIKFTHYSGTFLPQVMKEQGWNKVETMTALLRKSGYSGKVGIEVLEKIEVTRYKSTKASADFQEWQEYKLSLDRKGK